MEQFQATDALLFQTSLEEAVQVDQAREHGWVVEMDRTHKGMGSACCVSLAPCWLVVPVC